MSRYLQIDFKKLGCASFFTRFSVSESVRFVFNTQFPVRINSQKKSMLFQNYIVQFVSYWQFWSHFDLIISIFVLKVKVNYVV